MAVGEVSHLVVKQLQEEYPQLKFRYRTSIKKEEINEALKKIDSELGQTLFVSNSSIIPDGGIVEVKDDNDEWRVVLASEAKHQGGDIENIRLSRFRQLPFIRRETEKAGVLARSSKSCLIFQELLCKCRVATCLSS